MPLKAWDGRIRASPLFGDEALTRPCVSGGTPWDGVPVRMPMLPQSVTAPALRRGEKAEFAEGPGCRRVGVGVTAQEQAVFSPGALLGSSLSFPAFDLAVAPLEAALSTALRRSDKLAMLADGAIHERAESSTVGTHAKAVQESALLLYQQLRVSQRSTREVWLQSELAYFGFGLVFSVIGYYRYPTVRPENIRDLWPIYTMYGIGIANVIASAIFVISMPLAAGTEAKAMDELLRLVLSSDTPAVDTQRVVIGAFQKSAERARSRRMLDGTLLLIHGIVGVFLSAALAWGQARVYGAVELDVVAGASAAAMLGALGAYRLWARRSPLEEALEVLPCAIGYGHGRKGSIRERFLPF